MKKFYIFLLLVFINLLNVVAQSGVQISSMIPAKGLSYILKPGLAIEYVIKPGDIDDRFKMNGSVGVSLFRPTQDTFRTYGVQYSNNGTVLLPGYEVIKKYRFYSFGIGCEFKLLKDKKLSPVIGMDGYFYLVTYSESSQTETLVTSSVDNATTWEMALAPKIGLAYELKEKWLFNIGCSRSMGIGPPGHQVFWKPYFSINFYLD